MSTGWDRDNECENEDADLDEHPHGDDSAFLDISGMRMMMAVTIRITIKIMMKSRMIRRMKKACVLNHHKIAPIPCELRMGFVPKINFPSDLSSRKLHLHLLQWNLALRSPRYYHRNELKVLSFT